MDISDILRDLDHHAEDPFAAHEEDYSPSQPSGEADLQSLTRAWINERGTTELLPWPQDNLIDRISTRIKSQVERIEQLTGDMDPTTNFTLIILQTELERWKFLTRSYLRARLSKIDKHTLFYLSTPEGRAKISELEIQYATRRQGLLHSHFLDSFLAAFPERLRDLNDTAGGISMIEGPDEEGAVFVRGLGSREEGEREDGVVVKGRGRDGDAEWEVGRGEVVVARWADVKGLVDKGELELV
ncbi:putative SLD5 Part of GINS, replication multiprotein complex [Venustampulla echinocandica]|uniref:DNA replication complex GINS protein SLD5 n=1 Tax=Venustampulla echinocandica TaxID=2656787 RepID=A0A370T8X0_9HELO|nr:putative SLD5 Part of GINS, replication multiprotein complex [Venustampulla echinocandica]RDL29935.1 putative SLD5 Part of GINS, replication multiprotein complex [Venustampulla echinocandica]